MSEETSLEAVPGYRSAMLHEKPWVLRWLGRTFFDRVKVGEDTNKRLADVHEQGVVVYIMRTRSTLDYLFFNHLYSRIGLPLVQFGNGIDLTMFKDFGGWCKQRLSRIFGGPSPEPASLKQLAAAVRKQNPALLFMKVLTLTAERRSNAGFIARLVELQRNMDQPILLLPQHISWPRKPPSKRRTWFDIVFGDVDAAGPLRKLVHFVRFSSMASVQVGEPIDLKSVLEEHDGWTNERIATKVRRVLLIHLAREAMAISGPKVKSSSVIQREVLERRSFDNELTTTARRIGLAPEVARSKAARYLREISAAFNFEIVLIFGRMIDILFSRIFRGVELDSEGLLRVKEAAKLSRTAPLILVPSHKSHIDYMVISWAFLRNEFIPPHIAAGANLSFFPLGTLFRGSGAFFLRRSFSGMPIYKLVFRHYLWKLVREGYPVEFFIEGGRSRTGKMLPPRMGMVSMLLEGLRADEYKDLQFVPISISYEKVLETGSYRNELTGGEKESESVKDVVQAGRFLRSKFGRVYLNFEEPVRLSEYLQQREITNLNDLDEDAFRLETKKLSYHLIRRIQDATVVTPSSLLGTVLLSHHKRGIPAVRLQELIGFVLTMLLRRGARLSNSLRVTINQYEDTIERARERGFKYVIRARGEAVRPVLGESIELLKKLIERTERAGDVIYSAPDRHRIELDYYRNSILAVLAPDCIVATIIHGSPGAISQEELAAEARRLSRWLRLEFIYETGTTFESNFAETLEKLVEESLISVDDDGFCSVSAPKTVDFLRGMLLHLVEGYWVALDAMRVLLEEPMEAKEWIDYAREHCEKAFLQSDVVRAEAASTAIIKNALSLMIEEGLVQKIRQGTGRRSKDMLAIPEGVSLEDLAFRRDDLCMFLSQTDHDTFKPLTAPPDGIEPVALEVESSPSITSDYPTDAPQPKDVKPKL